MAIEIDDNCKDFLFRLWQSYRLDVDSAYSFFRDKGLNAQQNLDNLIEARLTKLVKGVQMEYGETFLVLTELGEDYMTELQFKESKYRWQSNLT